MPLYKTWQSCTDCPGHIYAICPTYVCLKGQQTHYKIFWMRRFVPKVLLMCPAILAQSIALETVTFCLVRDAFCIGMIPLESLGLLISRENYSKQPG